MALRGTLHVLARLAVLGAAFGLIAGYLGFLHPFFDTLSNFRLHIFWVLLGAFPIMLILKFKREAMLAIIIAAMSLFGARAAIHLPSERTGGESFSLISYNMLYENDLRSDVVPWLVEQDADFLFVTEFSRFWKPIWQPLLDHYPYHSYCPEWQGRAGNYIFSQYPLDLESSYCQVYSALQLVDTEINGVTVTLGGTHIRWPWPASGPDQITKALPALKQLGDNALIVGDFNSVPWSYSMQRISKAGNLEIYSGIGPSWLFKPFPDWFRAIFGLPIDNAMKKGAVEIISSQRLPSMGSDHMPIKFELSIDK